MGKFLDLKGREFGRLTAFYVSGKTTSGGYSWLCVCECGAEKIIPSDHLVRKVQPVVSCGCYRDDQIRKACASPDQTAFNLLFGAYKKRARIKGRKFELSKDDFTHLTQSNCVYCGSEPSTISYNRPKTGSYTHNGIDRENAKCGYVKGNCVPCCKLCNYMKLAMSRDEFISHIHKIHAHQWGYQHAR